MKQQESSGPPQMTNIYEKVDPFQYFKDQSNIKRALDLLEKQEAKIHRLTEEVEELRQLVEDLSHDDQKSN